MPEYYKQAGAEAKTIIQLVLDDKSATPYEAWLIGNVLKYLIRYRHKGDALGDLYKASSYLLELVGKYEEETKN